MLRRQWFFSRASSCSSSRASVLVPHPTAFQTSRESAPLPLHTRFDPGFELLLYLLHLQSTSLVGDFDFRRGTCTLIRLWDGSRRKKREIIYYLNLYFLESVFKKITCVRSRNVFAARGLTHFSLPACRRRDAKGDRGASLDDVTEAHVPRARASDVDRTGGRGRNDHSPSRSCPTHSEEEEEARAAARGSVQ